MIDKARDYKELRAIRDKLRKEAQDDEARDEIDKLIDAARGRILEGR